MDMKEKMPMTSTTPATEPADRYTYDPGHPTPARLTDTSAVPFGPADRAALEQRPDVLVYTTAPVQKTVEVAGPLSAVLYVSTSAPSSDFFVRLIDVHPSGKAYPDMYSYVFDLGGTRATVPEQHLTPELRRLADLLLDRTR